MKTVYIHIPFCQNICSYCDFCKIYYNSNLVNSYLDALKKEVDKYYRNEQIETLYIGGGTPSSLSIDELKKLFKIIKKVNLTKDNEFTFECNIESIDKEKLKFLYENGVNRLSIGVETFNNKHLLFLERKHTKKEVYEKIKLAKEIGFDNINIDLIYGLPNQTLKELKEDLNYFLKLNIPHLSAYSLIIEPHTKLYITKNKNIDEELDYKMYQLIKETLEENNYIQYEISNYCKKGYKSKHNLTYWNNLKYYGFGLGASGYIDNIRYDNTRSIDRYLDGYYRLNEEKITDQIKLENELILGFRKIKGINKKEFYNKYKRNINDLKIIQKLIKERKLIDDGLNIYINPKYIYLSNDILINFIGDKYE